MIQKYFSQFISLYCYSCITFTPLCFINKIFVESFVFLYLKLLFSLLFEQRAPHFCFALDPMNYAAGLNNSHLKLYHLNPDINLKQKENLLLEKNFLIWHMKINQHLAVVLSDDLSCRRWLTDEKEEGEKNLLFNTYLTKPNSRLLEEKIKQVVELKNTYGKFCQSLPVKTLLYWQD